MSEKSAEVLGPLDAEQVRKFLPHRFPFLLIDKVEEVTKTSPTMKVSKDHVGSKVRAIKNVSANEPFFTGHFPSHMIMPGVLIIEAMAQAAVFSFFPSQGENPGDFADKFSMFLVGAEEFRFRRPVVPGDRLVIHTELVKSHSSMIFFDCYVEVDGHRVAEGKILSQVKEMT